MTLLRTYFLRGSVCALLLIGLAGCQTARPPAPKPATAKPEMPKVAPPPVQHSQSVEPATPAQVGPDQYPALKVSTWNALPLPAITDDQWRTSWTAWLHSCQALQKKAAWQSVCQLAQAVNAADAAAIAGYWQTQFDVYQLTQDSGEALGLITGYYQPVLRGARVRSSQYHVPLYKAPDDLIQVNLADLYPELKFKRLRGRLQGRSLIPYYTRAEIEQDSAPLSGSELLWVDDAVEAFFLQVQGSGVVMLENGERVHVGYADQNGHPYQSIGKLLVARGEMSASEASMQGIKGWGQRHPQQLQALLNQNPSYVFFKALPAGLSGPLGALGVPLTAAHSIAVDPAYVPLGAPVLLSTTYPNSTQPLQQVVMAQDTGGAIKGVVRADLYWGEGEAAGKLAGAMRQQGNLWVWLPKGYPLQ